MKVGPAEQYSISWYKRHSVGSTLYDKRSQEEKCNRNSLNASLNTDDDMIGFCWLDSESSGQEDGDTNGNNVSES